MKTSPVRRFSMLLLGGLARDSETMAVGVLFLAFWRGWITRTSRSCWTRVAFRTGGHTS